MAHSTENVPVLTGSGSEAAPSLRLVDLAVLLLRSAAILMLLSPLLFLLGWMLR